MSIWLIYPIGWGHQSFIWTKIRQRLKLSTMMWNHFLRNNKETVHVDPSMQKYIWYFQFLAEITNTVEMKTILGKSVLALDFFQPKLANLQQVTTLIGTGGGPTRWTHDNMTLWTTKHNHILYGDCRGFAEVALRNISKWGCSQSSMS